MTVEDIERLIRRLEHSDIAALTVCDETSSLTLRIGPALKEAGAASSGPRGTGEAARPEDAPVLRSPSIGWLRLRHPEAAAPGEDDRVPRLVGAGDIVAFLECGAVLRPVAADCDGTLGTPLQEDGALVGFGTPLFAFIRAARPQHDPGEG